MFLLLQISICEAKSFMEKRYLLKDFVKGIDSLTYNIHDRNVEMFISHHFFTQSFHTHFFNTMSILPWKAHVSILKSWLK